jgi:transposase
MTRRRERYAKLKPCMETVHKLPKAGVFNAVVIYRESQAPGYDGKIRVLCAYIEPRRSLWLGLATVYCETEPARQPQHDRGEVIVPVGGKARSVHIAVSVLGYSRRFHVIAVTPSTPARAWFGGVTRQVWVDNHKSAVSAHVPGRRALQRTLQATGPPLRPAVRTVRAPGARSSAWWAMPSSTSSSATGLSRALRHLNQLLEARLLEEADRRLHGTVKEVVAVRFEREQPALMPLPAHRLDTSYIKTRQVGWDAYINMRGNRYSVLRPTAAR